MISAQILNITEEALFDDLLQQARERGMHLISDGQRTLISPIVPPGFIKIAVKIKTPTHASLVPIAAAA